MRIASAVAALLVTSLVFCGPRKGSHASEGKSVISTEPALSLEASSAMRSTHAIKTVWIIVMENHDWRDIHRSPSAPYINDTLLPLGAHAERYENPQRVHPSEPNYIWLEAGDDLDISDNDDPDENYRTTKNHLARAMEDVGVSWRSFQEGIPGDSCPISSSGRYKAKHNPFVFFDDVTEGRNRWSARCINRIRPFEELGFAAVQYNFITPDQCHDMHDVEGCETPDSVKNGDLWLSREVPKILDSKAYRDGGVLFITWDENEGDDNPPLGLIALSPFAKPGYSNAIPYSHSSLVRTVQDIFAIRPYMRDATQATSLSDLFTQYP